jgi:2',3'-cyclic-nucleotide 2'-phosphodiesterase (5'-nucleotidase family)
MFNYKNFKTIAASFLILFITVSLFAKTIEVISFNDFHGRLEEDASPRGKDVGMEKFVTAVKNEVKECSGNAILVSAGDSYQGSAITVLTKGAPVSDMMKEIHVAASAVGNHEFDWGIDSFNKWEKDGDFPFLAANIINKKTNKPVKWAKPYLIIKKDGVKVAFIGLATIETPFVTAKKNIKTIDFIDSVKATQQWIDFLNAGKDETGKPDVIIALTHIASYQDKPGAKITGKEINDLCSKTKGLNAVISGHSHKIVCGYINNIAVVQAYSNGRALGILKIDLSDNNKLEKIIPSVMAIYKNKDKLQKDKEATKIYSKYLEQMKKLDKPVGKTTGDLLKNESGDHISGIGAWVTKAMAEQTDSQIAVVNSGGLRTGLKAGNITVTDMYGLMPFDNTILTMELSGRDLKRVMEHSLNGTGEFYGLKVHYDSNAPIGEQIVSMTLLNGKPIEMNKDYTVVTLDFAFDGGDKFDFSGAKNVKKSDETLRDLLIKEIKEKKTIHPVKTDYLINVADQQKAA